MTSKKPSLLLTLLLTANIGFATTEPLSTGRKIHDTTSQKFKAEEPWDPATVSVVSGLGCFAIGAIATSPSNNVGTTLGVGALVGAIGALIFGYPTYLYKRAYTASNGLNINGAAAANNPAGVRAWLDRYGTLVTLEKDKEGKTALMYAAGNGACQAAEVILDAMPKTKTIIEATHKSESYTTPVLWPIVETNKVPERTTTKTETFKTVNTIDEQDMQGRTAIIHAAYGEHIPMMHILFEHGANGGIKDKLGNDIANLAQSSPAVKEFTKQAQTR